MNKVLARDTSVDASNKNPEKFRHWNVQLRHWEFEVSDPLFTSGKVLCTARTSVW